MSPGSDSLHFCAVPGSYEKCISRSGQGVDAETRICSNPPEMGAHQVIVFTFEKCRRGKFMNRPFKILYLDHEGGWGGASRSLYYLVKGLDRSRFEPVVWHRKEGPIEEAYHSVNIRAERSPDIVSILPLKNKNWKNILVHNAQVSASSRSSSPDEERVPRFDPLQL